MKFSFEHTNTRKFFSNFIFRLPLIEFFHVSWTKNLNLLELLVMGARFWFSYFDLSKYLDHTQYFKMLLLQCGHKKAKVQATVTRLDEDEHLICLAT